MNLNLNKRNVPAWYLQENLVLEVQSKVFRNLLQEETRTPFGMHAGGLLTTLVVVLAFVLFEGHFISGITAGAVNE